MSSWQSFTIQPKDDEIDVNELSSNHFQIPLILSYEGICFLLLLLL
jgi:hypothetical protein